MGMNDLPIDISLNIFSRLHVDSVLDCKLVSKPWLHLLKNPSFAQTHLARRKLLLSSNACDNVELGFLLLEKMHDKSNDRTLHYVEYNVDAKKKSYRMTNKTINVPPIKQTSDSEAVVVGSCNGLICSTIRHHQLNDPIHICNPVTREYVYLPRYQVKIGSKRVYEMASGFGYSPLTDEYKVVRIYHKGGSCFFQVYCIGNESDYKWTDEKEIPGSLFHYVGQSKGVVVDAEIHWLDRESKIVAFSLANEEFHHIASPLPLVEADSTYLDKKLCVLGDRLCLVHRVSSARERIEHVIDIWLLRKNNDTNVQQNGSPYNWNKEFTLQVETRRVVPLAFTNNGKVVFSHGYRFVSYDTKDGVLEKLSMYDNGYAAGLTVYEATCHVNSFVSLKALGVKKCRRRLQYTGIFAILDKLDLIDETNLPPVLLFEAIEANQNRCKTGFFCSENNFRRVRLNIE